MTDHHNSGFEPDDGGKHHGDVELEDPMGDLRVTIKNPADVNIDMRDRDPTRINEHIRVAFEDIFAEPDSTHSSDYVWGSSFRCFNKSKTCCYNCLSTVCAVPCAVYWGLVFACTIFWQIWFIVPSLRLLAINMWAVGKQNSLYVHALCDPWCESCGRLFSQIKVHVLKD